MIKRLIILLLLTVSVFATVTDTTTKYQYFSPNGSTTTFTFTMPCNSSDDIKVEKVLTSTGVPSTLVEDTGYTIAPTSGDYLNGGVVTIDPALAGTYDLVITRNIVLTQESVAGSINATTVELAFDKSTRQIQDNRNKINLKTMRIPDSDPTTAYAELANYVERAGYWLGWDSSTGAPFAGTPAATGISVSAFMVTVNDDASAVLAMATLQGIPVINVMNSAYGADGTGSTSDNAAIALAATAAADSTLVFPKGTYLIDADITIGSTVSVAFLKGAQLSIDSGKTVTILGPVTAGNYQIFTGDGSVAFSTNPTFTEEIPNWNTVWFGTDTGTRSTLYGHRAGENLDSATASANTGFGYQTLQDNTTGAKNTAVGTFALRDNIIGDNSSAFGYLALAENTGINNTAVGSNALANNPAAAGGTAVGTGALRFQNANSAINNTAVGLSAGSDNLSGSNLTIVGARAMLENTTALNGVAIGVEAAHGNIHNEQIRDGDFSVEDLPTGWTLGSGWAVDNSNNEVDKSSDGTGTLTATETQGGDAHIDYGVGVTYQIAYSVTNHTVGNVIATFGGETDTTRTEDGDYTWNVTPSVYNDAARALTFTPSNTSRFSMTDVSFTLSTAASHSGLTAVGVGAGYMVTEGDNNVAIGLGAMRQNGAGKWNTVIGTESFRQGGGSSNIGLGYQSGRFETGSNKLHIDSILRSSEADGRIKALVYGEIAADPDDQLFRVNGMFESYAVSTRTVEVSSAEMLDLAASPKELVAAPGADHLLEFVSATLIYDSAATDYTVQADENIAIRYENGSGTIVSLTVESDDLIKEAASDGIRIVHPIATFQNTDVVGAVNKSLVLDNVGSGEWDDGTGTLTVKITWRIHELGL